MFDAYYLIYCEDGELSLKVGLDYAAGRGVGVSGSRWRFDPQVETPWEIGEEARRRIIQRIKAALELLVEEGEEVDISALEDSACLHALPPVAGAADMTHERAQKRRQISVATLTKIDPTTVHHCSEGWSVFQGGLFGAYCLYWEDGVHGLKVDLQETTDTVVLEESNWRFDGPEGAGPRVGKEARRGIIERIKAGAAMLNSRQVDSTGLEISGGMHTPLQAPDTVELVNGETVRWAYKTRTVTVPIAFVTYERVDIRLDDIGCWDPPLDSVSLDAKRTNLAIESIDEFLAKRGCTLTVHE